MMFIYESLKEHEKTMIHNEIERAYKKLVLNNKGFDYTESQFNTMVNELVIYNETIDSLIGGTSLSYFNLKDTVVRSKALEIAYDIEVNRPDINLLCEYIELCRTLQLSPSLDVLFDSNMLSDLVNNYKHHFEHELKNFKANENKFTKVVDIGSTNDYTKSSLIIWFVEIARELYDVNDFEIAKKKQLIQNNCHLIFQNEQSDFLTLS